MKNQNKLFIVPDVIYDCANVNLFYKDLIKSFSTTAYRNSENQAATMESSVILDPGFLTGFIDAEGCFTLSIYRDISKTLGWRVQGIFSIELHDKDTALLNNIQATLGVGKIYSPRSATKQYRVTSVKDLQVIVNHLDNYPLVTQKRSDYELFKLAIDLIENKEHLTPEGLEKLVSIRASINLGLTSDLKAAYPNITPYPKLEFLPCVIKDPNWLAGFTSGEGCFFIDIKKSKTTRLGETVQLRFNISQHSRDENLIKSLADYLGCGKVFVYPEVVSFNITSLGELDSKVLPFFAKYPIQGVKLLDYYDFVKVVRLMKSKAHLTAEGLDIIRNIKEGMNRKRD